MSHREVLRRWSLRPARAGLVAGVLVVPSIAGARSIANDTPSQILAITVHAAVAAKTTQVSCTGTFAAVKLSEASTTDIGPTYGSQSSTVTEGSLVGKVMTRLVAKTAYFNGNAAFLKPEYNVSNSKYAGTWISVAPGQPSYSTVSSGLSMATIQSQIDPVAPLSKSGIIKHDGQSVVEVSGHSTALQAPGKGLAHVYVGSSAPNLPVALVYQSVVNKATFNGTCTLSHWKLRFSVSKPAKSTPITKTNL